MPGTSTALATSTDEHRFRRAEVTIDDAVEVDDESHWKKCSDALGRGLGQMTWRYEKWV